MWIQFGDQEIDAYMQALRKAGRDDLAAEIDAKRQSNVRTEAHDPYYARAREDQIEGEMEVDEDAVVSLSANRRGAYVMTWQFLYAEDVGLPEPDEEDEEE